MSNGSEKKKPEPRAAASVRSLGGSGDRRRNDRLSITGIELSWYVARFGTLALIYVALILLVSPALYRFPFEFSEGDLAQRKFVAPYPLQLVNEYANAEKRREIREQAPRFYLFSGERKAPEQVETLRNLFRIGERLRLTDIPRDEAIQQLRDVANREHALHLSPEEAGVLYELGGNATVTESLEGFLRRTLVNRLIVESQTDILVFAQRGQARLLRGEDQTLEEAKLMTTRDVRDEILERPQLSYDLRRRLSEAGLQQEIDVELNHVVSLLASLIPNTLRRYIRAEQDWLAQELDQLEPITVRFATGEVLVSPGERIESFKADVLRAYNAKLGDWWSKFGKTLPVAIFVGLLLLFGYFYCRRFHRDLPMTGPNIASLAYPLVLPLLLGRLALLTFEDTQTVLFAFPAALVGLTAVILIEARYAMMLVVGGAVLYFIAAGFNQPFTFSAFLVSLVSGGVAVSSTLSLRQRRDTLLAGLKAGLAGALMVIGVAWLQYLPEIPWHYAGATFVAGLVSGVLLYPSILLLESMTGITTDLRLMELTTIRHPLIQQLEARAPGTYQHTLNVMKLAEAGAISIGANDILVRAGTLFHDIGKADKPKYFSENQVSPEDRKAHDKLTPHMSALIIKEHVRNGILKARKAGLPERVVDFIPEHHGTTMIQFFYHKALKKYEESESNDPVRPSDFQHVGPKPQSVETAIVLLADSVDAVASAKLSGATVNRDEIRRVVRSVINQKFREEQFDECNLTLRDLSRIAEAFVRTLEARFHFRVKYPEAQKKREPGSGSKKTRAVSGSAAGGSSKAGEDSVQGSQASAG